MRRFGLELLLICIIQYCNAQDDLFIGMTSYENASITTWDLGNVSYGNQYLSTASQDPDPRSWRFNSDGTKGYMLGRDGDDYVFQYAFSTAWDLSTGSYASKSFAITGHSDSRGMTFKPDGTKMYITDRTAAKTYQYALSTAWDVSTASYEYEYSWSSQETSPRDIAFNNSGTKVFMTGTGDKVYRYSLSTAYRISTASYDSQYFDLSSQTTSTKDVKFNSDGTKMFTIGSDTDAAYQYTLSTAWDLTTAIYASKTKDVSSEETYPGCIEFKPDGTLFFIIGYVNDKVRKYIIN